MAKLDWTDEQNRILEAEGNIIVSAAAGSGKTAVLTERIIRKVCEGTPLCDMLIVTFTHAAAGEMRARIEKKLYERLHDEQDEKMRSYLYGEVMSCPRANISTLHSFCTNVLRRHFYEVNLSPAFRVGDETEITLLKNEAIDDVLMEYFDGNDASTGIIDFMSGEENLTEAIFDLYNTMQVRFNGDEWLTECVKNYNISEEELRSSWCFSELSEYAKDYINLAIEYTERSFEYSASDKQTDVINGRMSYLLNVKSNIDNYEACRAALAIGLPGFGGKGKLSDELEACNKISKKCIDDTKKKYFYSMKELHEQITSAYPYVLELSKLVYAFAKKYSEKKAARCIIDFNDMEQLTIKLLQNDAIANIYKEKFSYVFVDEYQDINQVQDEIISRILRNDNAFFVGDVKQSIYRFRHAKPQLFIDKMQEYAQDENSHCMNLGSNFRSSDAVVSYVNNFFSVLMTKETAGMDYDKDSMLIKKSAMGKGKTYLKFIEKAEGKEQFADDDDENSPERLLAAESQALFAAEKIKSMMKNDMFYDADEKCERHYRYSDFAVIMRAKVQSDIFAREFMLCGIPTYLDMKGESFASLEVQVFENLLRIIDNRRQDIPMLSVMRSVIGGFSTEELASMRNMTDISGSGGSKKTVFDMLKNAAETSGDIGKSAKQFIEKIDAWYEKSKYMPLEEFVQILLDETGYYRYVCALPDGKRRSANLDDFTKAVHSYAANYGKGLYDFLGYIDNAKNANEGSSESGDAGCAVHILTIHKSKGLEFNVVIIPAMERQAVAKPVTPPRLLCGEDNILGIRFTINRIKYTSIYYDSLDLREARASIADELRILYVAFTRAKDSLIIMSSLKSLYEKVIANDVSEKHRTLHITKSKVQSADWLLHALVNSDTEQLNEAVDTGYAESELLAIEKVPYYVCQMPAQDIDDLYFRNYINELKTEDTTEQEADFAWKYPYEADTKIVSKGSVTGFAHADTYVAYNNAGAQRNTLSAAHIGTATHLVFEKIPLQAHTVKSINDFIAKCVNKGDLTEEEANAVNTHGIADFFARDIAKRMEKSERLLREQEFACYIEANRLSDEFASDANILVQGVIDCCFIENGKWVIVDYKTDSVDKNDSEAVEMKAQSHKKQLELYAYILKKITGIEVAEGYISFVNAYEVQVL